MDSNNKKVGPDFIQHKVVQDVWRASVHPKIKETVQEEPVRMWLQALSWTLMGIFLLVAIIYATVKDRCETTSSLLQAADVNTDGYKCDLILAPQEFEGQTYYETALWWGFAVSSAWGTFGGSNWTAYCGELLGNISEIVNNEEGTSITTDGGIHWSHTWNYAFENTAGGTDQCGYVSALVAGANELPNAPGGVLGCSGPDGLDFDCQGPDGLSINGSDIAAVWSTSDSFDVKDTFCPDFFVWDPSYVKNSPLDEDQTNDELCSIWGQDVGIVSRSVQACSKEICLKWYIILANAVALAGGVQSVVLLCMLFSFKLNESRKAKIERKKRGGGEEKDGDGDDQQGEDEDRDMKSLAKETATEVFNYGKSFTPFA